MPARFLGTTRRSRRVWTACAVLTFIASACSSPITPTPTPTPSPTPSAFTLRMSGRVVDDAGVPVSGAYVQVTFKSSSGVSNPASHCSGSPQFCWIVMRTNDLGEYAAEFQPLSWPQHGLGYVHSFSDGYEVDVQWVPTGPSPAVRDLRLRPTRSIPAGASTTVTVEPTSSLCTDLEDNWALAYRCEIVVIDSSAGTLMVEARPNAGGPAPSMFWYTTGNYAGLITRPAPGTVSIPARGGSYRVLIGIPEGAPPQSFIVTTSLR